MYLQSVVMPFPALNTLRSTLCKSEIRDFDVSVADLRTEGNTPENERKNVSMCFGSVSFTRWSKSFRVEMLQGCLGKASYLAYQTSNSEP